MVIFQMQHESRSLCCLVCYESEFTVIMKNGKWENLSKK